MNYRNPIISGCHPDPSICRAGDDYYLVNSSFEYFPGVPIFHSRDLFNWKEIGHCLTRKSQLKLEKAKSSNGIFAPTIRCHDGTFYMTTTNFTIGGNFFVSTDDPAGEWSDPIWVDQEGIDPSLFFDEGKVYYATSGREGILQSEIDMRTGKKTGDVICVWKGTGGQFPEGPHMYKRGGLYYLMIAEGGTEYGHMETIARSSSPRGPFEACPHNPILTHRSISSPVQAVGHADMVEAADGTWWAACLGIRPSGYPYRHHLGRETFLVPVRWSSDGWPVMGEDGRIPAETLTSDAPVRGAGTEGSVRDDFNSAKLDVNWNFLRNPNVDDWSLSDRPGWLRLASSPVTLNDEDSPAFLGRRQEHFECRVSTLVDFMPRSDNEEAGLVIRMNETHHYEIALTCRGDKRCVIVRRRIGSLSSVVAREEIPGGNVTLSIKADRDTYYFSYSVGSSQEKTIASGETKYLATEVAGGFIGVYLGMYATANGRTSGTPAYFDWFEYV